MTATVVDRSTAHASFTLEGHFTAGDAGTRLVLARHVEESAP